MRISAWFAIGALSIGVSLGADLFPATPAETLTGKKVDLPAIAKGRVAVLVIGFTHASQNQTKPWGQKIPREIETYPVAVLEDVPKLFRGMASGGIKSSVAADARERFLLVYKGEKEMKQAVGFDQPDDAYVVLLDPQGAIRWRFHGAVTDAALAELKSQAAALVDSH